MNLKKGDLVSEVEVVTQDEVGEASACFNEMVYDMKRLIDENYVMELKERNSELDALRAQINPHFLYNALDSLYWRTTEAGNDEVADHILALSDIFRLVLSRGEGIVAVRYGQELLNRYLQIQQMRFGESSEVSNYHGSGYYRSKNPQIDSAALCGKCNCSRV